MSAGGRTARAACRNDDDPLECENLKPSGDTFRHHPNDLDPAHLVRMHDKVVESLVEKIKRFVEFERPVKIGIDSTDVELPGDPEKTDPAIEEVGEMFRELPDDSTGQFVHGVQDEDSDAKCYRFITLNIVGQHFRIPLVVRPIPKGVPRELLVSELYWLLRSPVQSAGDRVYRGGVSGRRVLQRGRAVVTQRVPVELRGVRPQARPAEAGRKADAERCGGQAGSWDLRPRRGDGKTYAKTNIVAMPSNRNPDKTVIFATDKDVRDEIGLDRRRESGGGGVQQAW